MSVVERVWPCWKSGEFSLGWYSMTPELHYSDSHTHTPDPAVQNPTMLGRQLLFPFGKARNKKWICIKVQHRTKNAFKSVEPTLVHLMCRRASALQAPPPFSLGTHIYMPLIQHTTSHHQNLTSTKTQKWKFWTSSLKWPRVSFCFFLVCFPILVQSLKLAQKKPLHFELLPSFA